MSTNNDNNKVSYGYQQVDPEEKTQLVGGVFRRVAERYDIMNDLMSLGTHRIFKRMLVEMAGIRSGHKVLDLAGGTGDVAALLAPMVGTTGGVFLTDPNPQMISVGRDRLLDQGLSQVRYCRAYGEALPELLGGSADLAGSNLTLWSGSKGVSAAEGSGNYTFVRNA